MGHLYEYDQNADNGQTMGVMVMPNPPRVQYWGFTKRTLLPAGFTVVQDGDGEGAATFDPSSAEQVKLALKVAKVKKRRVPSPKQLEVIARMNAKHPQKGTLSRRRG